MTRFTVYVWNREQSRFLPGYQNLDLSDVFTFLQTMIDEGPEGPYMVMVMGDALPETVPVSYEDVHDLPLAEAREYLKVKWGLTDNEIKRLPKSVVSKLVRR